MFPLRHRQVRRGASCLAAALVVAFAFEGQLSVSAGMRAIDDRGDGPTSSVQSTLSRPASNGNSKTSSAATHSPADPFWDLNGITAGSGGPSPTGAWNTTSAFWNNTAAGDTTAPIAWTNGSNLAVFSAGTDATGSYTVTVTGTITTGGITFQEGTVTLAGASTPVLTIGAGGVAIDSTINGTTTFDSSLGTISTGGTTTTNETWANNSSQNFVVNSGVQISKTGTLTLGGSGSGSVTGIISQNSGSGANQGSLVKTGGGSFTLTGPNTYGGNVNGTTVSAGTLFVNNTTGSGTGAGTVTVNGTGTLGGSGTISGAVTASASGAKINPGGTAGAIGTLTTGALTMNSNSVFSVDMTSTTADKLLVNGTVTLTLASLKLNIPTNTVFTAGQAFTLIDPSGISSAFGGTAFSNAPTGTNELIDGYLWNVIYNGGDGNDFVITAVPEPSTWVAAGLSLLVIAYSQRRRFARPIKRVG